MSDIPKSRRDAIHRANQPGVSEARCSELIVAGVAAGTNKLYIVLEQMHEQLTAESIANFAKLEDEVVRRVQAELDRRSWRGRIRLRWLVVREWIRGYAIEAGVVNPVERRSNIKLEVADAPQKAD